MAKGQVAKQQLMATILEQFPGSFLVDKVIRVPMVEDGEPVQIKITLTAAKDIVESGADVALPGEVKAEKVTLTDSGNVTSVEVVPPSQEEIDLVNKMAEKLGF